MNIPSEHYVPKKMHALHDLIEQTISTATDSPPSVFDLMAICWTETLGEFFWDCSNCMFKTRVGEVETVTDMKTYEFLNLLRCGKGENQSKLPRFLFDAGAYHFLQTNRQTANWNQGSKVLAATGLGVALRFFSHDAKELSEEEFVTFIDAFKRSPELQLRYLANDLAEAGGCRAHQSRKVIEKFYSGESAHNANFPKAGRVVDLANSYRAAYTAAVPGGVGPGRKLDSAELAGKTA